MSALRRMFAADAERSMREAHRCVRDAITLEREGAGNSYECHFQWLGAVLYDFRARIFGYRGPSLETQFGRPPRPVKGRTH